MTNKEFNDKIIEINKKQKVKEKGKNIYCFAYLKINNKLSYYAINGFKDDYNGNNNVLKDLKYKNTKESRHFQELVSELFTKNKSKCKWIHLNDYVCTNYGKCVYVNKKPHFYNLMETPCSLDSYINNYNIFAKDNKRLFSCAELKLVNNIPSSSNYKLFIISKDPCDNCKISLKGKKYIVAKN